MMRLNLSVLCQSYQDYDAYFLTVNDTLIIFMTMLLPAKFILTAIPIWLYDAGYHLTFIIIISFLSSTAMEVIICFAKYFPCILCQLIINNRTDEGQQEQGKNNQSYTNNMFSL